MITSRHRYRRAAVSKKSKSNPTHQDAELVLRLYDMRREAVMRQSRDGITFQFWPHNWDDVVAVMDFEHPLNAAFRQVSSYWEMVFGMGHKGIIDAEFLVENSGEGILLYCKLRPFLDQLREMHPDTFQHSIWAATKTKAGRDAVQRIETRFAEQLGLLPAEI
jgi:hypothetical protein